MMNTMMNATISGTHETHTHLHEFYKIHKYILELYINKNYMKTEKKTRKTTYFIYIL